MISVFTNFLDHRYISKFAVVAVCLSSALVGCGGGGGGGGASIPSLVNGHTFVTGRSTTVVSVTVSGDSRFTIFASDSVALPAGAGAQGTLNTNGSMSVQNDAGTVAFAGQFSTDGGSITGTFTPTGKSPVAFAARVVTAGTASTAGNYVGTGSGSSAFITIDSGSHASVFASVGGVTGGGIFDVTPSLMLTAQDNSAAGQIQATPSGYFLILNKWNGAATSASIPLTLTTKAKWTFIVFLNGANNLQQFGPLNFNQMEKVGSTSDVNIVVQWKQASCFDCGSPDWQSTRRYYVTKDNDIHTVNSTLVQDMGPNIDMGDYRQLHNFITWSQQRYPADHYALVVWDHGAGWRDTKGVNKLKQTPRSVSIDDNTGNEIETWQLTQALDVTPKVDLVVFDASLMQMTEVAYEIRNSASFVVGSEESPPGEGYVYNTFLSDLVANPSMTPQQLGAFIVSRTLESYGSSNNLTQSEIDLSKMQAVADALNTFGNSLKAHVGDSASAMTNARNNAQSYAYPDNKDLWDYANIIRLGTSAADLKTAATGVQAAIEAAAILEKHGTINGNSHGLAIYVPQALNYRGTYTNLALSRATSWGSWLQAQP